MNTLLLLAVVVCGADGEAPPQYSGHFYEKGSDRKTLLFTNDAYLTREGNVRKHHVVFKDPKGVPLVTEDAVYVNDHLTSFKTQQHQLNATGTLDVVDKKVRLT